MKVKETVDFYDSTDYTRSKGCNQKGGLLDVSDSIDIKEYQVLKLISEPYIRKL